MLELSARNLHCEKLRIRFHNYVLVNMERENVIIKKVFFCHTNVFPGNFNTFSILLSEVMIDDELIVIIPHLLTIRRQRGCRPERTFLPSITAIVKLCATCHLVAKRWTSGASMHSSGPRTHLFLDSQSNFLNLKLIFTWYLRIKNIY